MIKCVSYNCRGWKSGSHFVNHLLSQCDLCFIQEHWLLNDHLTNLIIDDNFSFTATSGINDSELILGRPYGGCAILFRKKLHPSISCIITNFSRFSALTFSNSSHVTLIICVYLPTDYGTLSSQEQFAETVDELHGFINSINHDSLLVAGDFNVDFTRDSCNSIYLLQLMEELDLVAVDSLSKNIKFTYERDGGRARSWPDHVLSSRPYAHQIFNVETLHSADNFSDHTPLFFNFVFNVQSCAVAVLQQVSRTPQLKDNRLKFDWSKTTTKDVSYFLNSLKSSLPAITDDLLNCCNPKCISHYSSLDLLCHHSLSCILSCAKQCLPLKRSGRCVIPGWNERVRSLRDNAIFWNNLWKDAGCPALGSVADIRKKTKSKFKYAVRRLKRRRKFIIREKLSHLLGTPRNIDIWKEVKNLNNTISGRTTSASSTVDGCSDNSSIAEVFKSNLSSILNSNPTSCLGNVNYKDNTTEDDLKSIFVYPEIAREAFSHLKIAKSDGTGIPSDLLIIASPVITDFYSHLFTAIFRHGYMPKSLRDCVVIPVPKGKKDPTLSDNYRPITLAPNLSKVLEWCFVLKYRSFLVSSDLQFGFKPGFSTDLCSNILKNTVSTYLHNGSNVYACFLDASKAFDRVDHSKLFDILARRSLPPPLLAFLQNWYKDQAIQVRWNDVLSQPFGVSNGVRQGGVLSPILFTVYIDELINMLSQQDIGCHYGPYFCGVLGYADDIVLLSPSPCGLRCQLTTCETFASSFNLTFNSSKSQLICFSKVKNSIPLNSFTFNGEHMQAVSSVTHLGCRYTQTLDDLDDIQLATSEMCRRANCFFQLFSFCDPIVKTFFSDILFVTLWGLHMET